MFQLCRPEMSHRKKLPLLLALTSQLASVAARRSPRRDHLAVVIPMSGSRTDASRLASRLDRWNEPEFHPCRRAGAPPAARARRPPTPAARARTSPRNPRRRAARTSPRAAATRTRRTRTARALRVRPAPRARRGRRRPDGARACAPPPAQPRAPLVFYSSRALPALARVEIKSQPDFNPRAFVQLRHDSFALRRELA